MAVESHFGDSGDDFRDDEARTDLQKGEMAAARVQHHFARQVWFAIDSAGTSVPALSKRVGYQDPESLYRVLRGDVQMPQSVMFALVQILRIDLRMTIEREGIVTDLFPGPPAGA